MFAHRRFHGQRFHEQFAILVREFLGMVLLSLTDQPAKRLVLLRAMG